MIDLVLIRHGESSRNLALKDAHEGNWQPLREQMNDENDYEPGWRLTQAGMDQAVAAGNWLKEAFGKEPHLFVASPYLRTIQTARLLQLDRAFQIDWRIRERRWGDHLAFGAKPYSPEQYLDDLKHAGEFEWRSGLPGGESISDLVAPVRQFILDQIAPLKSGKVVLVTHGGALKAFRRILEDDMDQITTTIPNASILHYRIAGIGVDGRAVGSFEYTCPWQHIDFEHHWQKLS